MTPPFRPLDELSPELTVTRLTADELLVAVPLGHPLAVGDAIDIGDLAGQAWVSSRNDGETTLGVWPGLPGRPNVVHSTPDWLAKLQLVACGAGITTISPLLLPVLPPGVRALPVQGGSREHRRAVVARLPKTTGASIDAVEKALQLIASELGSGTTGAPRR
jgi:DNA-binding transcriptional LysR family regulator